jgi:arylsulfatase A
MRCFPRISALLLLIGVGVFPCVAAAGSTPNVVVFLVDDMGWSDWEQDGRPNGSSYYETPSMNRLAQAGVSFSNAYSASPVCSPTRNALVTGKHPARTRMTNWLPGSNYPSKLSSPAWNRQLAAEEVTLAEVFRDAGYVTGFVGKWHLGNRGTASEDPLEHGFDSNIAGNYRGGPNSWVGYFADRWGSFRLKNLSRWLSVPGDYLTDRLTDFAIDFIDRNADHDAPFFLLMSHYGVHTPLQAPSDRVDWYRAKPPSAEHSNATYAAMIETVDTSLGRILDRLELKGIRGETIVVFASDNGGSLLATSNAPLRGGKGLLYEGGIRTPLVVSWTGERRMAQGSESETVVVTQDLYPTLLELAGLPGDSKYNEEVDGTSFRAALEGDDLSCGASYWHYPHISPQSRDVEGGRFVSAVRAADWKLFYFYEDASWELYDLASDVGEMTDLADECAGIAAELGERMVDWLVAIDAQLPVDAVTGQPVALPVPIAEERHGRAPPRCGGRAQPKLQSPRCREKTHPPLWSPGSVAGAGPRSAFPAR